MFDRAEFARRIAVDGLAIVEGVFDPGFVARARTALEEAIRRETEWHGGTAHQDHGMVLVCPLHDRIFIDMFDEPRFTEPFEAVLGEGCITYAHTSSSMPPGPAGRNYSVRIHVDSPRLIPGYVTNMGATIALDDFTPENGATWFLPRSHAREDAPGEDEFFRGAVRFAAPAGSVAYFNARLWHRGGENFTSAWRHALTINMVRPWMKQRLDLPRVLAGRDLTGVSANALQKLGFLSQVPASLDEYYAPPDKRKFRQKTE